MLTKIIIFITCSFLSTLSYTGDLLPSEKARCTIDDVTKDILTKIFEIDIVRDPKQAGRLCAVCSTWNKIINDKNFTLRIIEHNPTYYAQRLTTAMCKELNSNPTPAVKKHAQAVAIALPTPVNRNKDYWLCRGPNICLYPGTIAFSALPGGALGTLIGGITSKIISDVNAVYWGLGTGVIAGPIIWVTIGGIYYCYARYTNNAAATGGVRGHA